MRSRRGALACVIFSLIGIGLCAYLGFLHLGLLRGELLGGAACGGTGSIFNCHAVTGGRFGSVASLPLWVWGLIGYLAFLNVSSIAWLFAEWTTHALTIVTALALACVLIDLALFATMVTAIRHLCLFCMLTYAVNVMLLLVGKRALAQPWRQIFSQSGVALRMFVPSLRRPLTWLFWVGMLIGTSGSVALHAATTYVSQGAPGILRNQINDFIGREPRAKPDIAGDPSLGPPDARLTLVEFSDFFCPACQKASQLNTIFLANHRRNARFIFKHFPLDTTCNDAIPRMIHPGACMIAAASECAHQQGAFWPFHDLVFEQGHLYDARHLETDIQRLGINGEQFERCLSSGQGMEAVRRDVAEGKRLGVASTPTYFVNGLKMPGIMSPAVFGELADALVRETQ